MKIELDCKEVSRLISDAQEDRLSPGDRRNMRLHFMICETGRNVDEQMGFLRRAMQRLGQDEPPAR